MRAELRSLSRETAERVARHLVSAGQLVDVDPEQALAHARAARALAGRVASVREAVGVTAYRAGEFAEALAELRAARRINGRDDHLPLMVDCERALGRPDRALALLASPAALRLDHAARVELKIVESGVRRDLGQADAAVLALQGPDLDSERVEPWTARLWYAYAAALLDAGRRDEALRWFHDAATVDDGETDAEERIVALTGAGDDAPDRADAADATDDVRADVVVLEEVSDDRPSASPDDTVGQDADGDRPEVGQDDAARASVGDTAGRMTEGTQDGPAGPAPAAAVPDGTDLAGADLAGADLAGADPADMESVDTAPVPTGGPAPTATAGPDDEEPAASTAATAPRRPPPATSLLFSDGQEDGGA